MPDEPSIAALDHGLLSVAWSITAAPLVSEYVETVELAVVVMAAADPAGTQLAALQRAREIIEAAIEAHADAA